MGSATCRRRGSRRRSLGMLAVTAGLAMPALDAAARSESAAENPWAPEAVIEGYLLRAPVAAEVEAWGRSTDEVLHDLHRLEPVEKIRLVSVLVDPQRGPAESQTDQIAMYLVMVSLMREVRLYNMVLVNRLRP